MCAYLNQYYHYEIHVNAHNYTMSNLYYDMSIYNVSKYVTWVIVLVCLCECVSVCVCVCVCRHGSEY